MTRTKTLLSLILFLLGGTGLADRPNVILLMTDDQGYGDIAAHGNPEIHTPAMDQLHAESVRLTDFHVDPTCAPTRAATMTGKYAHRARVWHTVRGGNHLRAGEVTMAEVFKLNGYDTALFGKWHLGANYPYRPMDRGFDEWLGLGDGGPGTSDDYFWNDRVNDTYWHNGEWEYREGYNPDVFYDAAIDYIQNRKSDKPFFLYLPTYAPHRPCTLPDPKLINKYVEAGVPASRALFYAMIERVDQNIGKLRKTLEHAGLTDNTLVIFMTDNGSTHGWTSFNAGMSAGKGSNLDGGHRVPCFFSWPAGKLGEPRDIPNLCAHIDLLPTLTELCSLQLPRKIDFDGTSLVPLLHKTGKTWPERTLHVEGQRAFEYKKGEKSAVMTQRWRLLSLKKLYDIQKDPAQLTDISSEHPEVVQRLKGKFDEYWDRVTPNDRTSPHPIVGTKHDKEIFLSISELRDGSGYEHNYMAAGKPGEGVWHLSIAKNGTYQIEVRRWPKEADAPITGLPTVTKTVDSWDHEPKTHLLYGSDFKELPVESVSIRVGEHREERSVMDDETHVTFDVDLVKGNVELDVSFLDIHSDLLTKAYYVYVRKK